MATITEKTMLVNLSISTWSGKVFDKTATKKVAQDFQAKEEAGRYIKSLIDRQSDSYKAIQKAANEIRIYHYSVTLPWLDNGERLLPSDMYLDYSHKMAEMKREFYQAVDDFIEDYDVLKSEAKKLLGQLYNESEYPNDLRSRFSVSVKFLPFPDKKDFRVDLSEAEKKSLEKQLDEVVSESENKVKRDLYERLRKPVVHLIEKLSEDGIFRDSLVGNVIEIAEMADKLNVTGDEKLSEIARDIMRKFKNVKPDDLRNDKKAKSEALKKANEIVNKMSKLFPST